MSALPKSIAIVTGVNISLSPVGREGEAASAQFVKVFNSVWGRLPVAAKAALAGAWKVAPATVFLTSKWTGQAEKLAQCAAAGTLFHFHSRALSRMPEEVLAACIAHELAHAFFFATGDPHHCGGLDDRFYDKAIQQRFAEALSRELSEAWGFNPRLLGLWCVSNAAWLEANTMLFDL